MDEKVELTQDPLSTGFQVSAYGHIESGDFRGIDNLYCKYTFHFGPSWKVLQGVDTGISQMSVIRGAGDNNVIWNFPLEITFKSVTAYGWPRLIVSVYGIDTLGRDVVRGYGTIHVPTTQGHYTRYVNMFTPIPSSYWSTFIAWAFGAQHEVNIFFCSSYTYNF